MFAYNRSMKKGGEKHMGITEILTLVLQAASLAIQIWTDLLGNDKKNSED